MKTSQTILVNNTGEDFGEFAEYFVACVRDGAELPEELADLFTVDVIEVADGMRGIVEWSQV